MDKELILSLNHQPTNSDTDDNGMIKVDYYFEVSIQALPFSPYTKCRFPIIVGTVPIKQTEAQTVYYLVPAHGNASLTRNIGGTGKFKSWILEYYTTFSYCSNAN